MDTAFHLTNKTILVTGASSGIGKQVSIDVSKMGGKVILLGRNIDRLNSTLIELTADKHQSFNIDLTNDNERSELIKELPKLDGIVHCAGVVNPYPIQFLTQKKIDETLNINYEVPVLLMSELIANRNLNKKASIVFLSSISGQHPHKGGAMYSGSKAAIEAFSKVLALELQNQGIRSNCISPGMVRTNMYEQAESGMSKESMDEHVAQYPLGVGFPEDISNATIFLLSDASRWMTGTNIILDGGFLLGK